MYFSVISVHCVVSKWQLVDLCCWSVVWIIMLISLMFCWTMQEQACVYLSRVVLVEQYAQRTQEDDLQRS